MALRALTTFFHEALGSDWSQESMAARRRTSAGLVSSILLRTEYSIRSWTPNFIVSDHVRSSSSRDRSGSFGLTSDIAPSLTSLPYLPPALSITLHGYPRLSPTCILTDVHRNSHRFARCAFNSPPQLAEVCVKTALLSAHARSLTNSEVLKVRNSRPGTDPEEVVHVEIITSRAPSFLYSPTQPSSTC